MQDVPHVVPSTELIGQASFSQPSGRARTCSQSSVPSLRVKGDFGASAGAVELVSKVDEGKKYEYFLTIAFVRVVQPDGSSESKWKANVQAKRVCISYEGKRTYLHNGSSYPLNPGFLTRTKAGHGNRSQPLELKFVKLASMQGQLRLSATPIGPIHIHAPSVPSGVWPAEWLPARTVSAYLPIGLPWMNDHSMKWSLPGCVQWIETEKAGIDCHLSESDEFQPIDETAMMLEVCWTEQGHWPHRLGTASIPGLAQSRVRKGFFGCDPIACDPTACELHPRSLVLLR